MVSHTHTHTHTQSSLDVTIGFEQSTYNTTEGGKAEACVFVQSPLEKVVVVTVFSSDDTATGTSTINIQYEDTLQYVLLYYRDAQASLYHSLGYRNRCFAKFISKNTNQCET